MSLIDKKKRRKWCLIGIQDHQAVFTLNGRIGAALGPLSFWSLFKKMRGKEPILKFLEEKSDLIFDFNKIEKIHSKAAKNIETLHRKTALSLIIGGAHDHGFTHLLGIKNTLKKNTRLGCINIDAHLDVRKPSPEISSGSPFYLAIENKTIRPEHFIEFGIQTHCNGPELWDYIEKKKIKTLTLTDLRQKNIIKEFKKNLTSLSKKTDAIVISFDLDACSESYAPGVSAPQSEGFTSREIIEMMEIAGQHPKVVSLGIFELNPLHDTDNKTARLAATSAFHFLEHAIKR